MLAFSRAVGAFVLMMVAGYLAMVVFLPAPSAVRAENLDPGQTAAVRLSAEAQALASPRPIGALQ